VPSRQGYRRQGDGEHDLTGRGRIGIDRRRPAEHRQRKDRGGGEGPRDSP